LNRAHPCATVLGMSTSLDISTPVHVSIGRAGYFAIGSMLTICAVGLAVVAGREPDASNDGAGAVPVIALLGIALAIARWHPVHDEAPSRGIARSLALSVAGVAVVAGGLLWIRPDGDVLTGIAITLALSAGYLLSWGYRSVALLRTVVLLSVLTWGPIGDVAHVIVRSSLEQPSELIYQRLAQFPAFGVHDEPWRLFTASLHRGSLVVIATLVFAIAANRWRISPREFVELALTVSAALVAHHVMILSSPIDEYDPASAVQFATNPTIEIAIAVMAVAVLGIARWQRRRQDTFATDREGSMERSVMSGRTTAALASDRDPVIFSPSGVQPRTTTALVLLGVVPLVVAVAS
jgi:hypothetical protein